MKTLRPAALVLVLITLFATAQNQPSSRQKPKLTLDEFFNLVNYSSIKLSPDGKRLLIATTRADWKQNRFRKDIWLWSEDAATISQLTQSGHDSAPQWSPDGRWIAFLSDRKVEGKEAEEEENVPKEAPPQTPPKGREDQDSATKEPVTHVYLISTSGGEAFPVTLGLEEVHAFAWSPDSGSLYFATRTPWNKAKRDAYKKEWKDVVRYRESERGDVIARIAVADAVSRQASLGVSEAAAQKPGAKETETAETPGSRLVSSTPYRVRQLVASPDGLHLAFTTDSVSQRLEGVEAYEIYVIDLPTGAPRQLTHNQAIEENVHWTPDSRALLFAINAGSVESKYEDVQNRVYSVNLGTGAVTRWAGKFSGAITDWDLSTDGSLLAAGRLGTEVQVYSEQEAAAEFKKHAGWRGTYERISTARHSPRVAVVYSALQRPTEVYVADSADQLATAKPVTALNKLFTERGLPEGAPYQWHADDGTAVEGMLIYPPGKSGAKRLAMLTLIHGGPADADGDKFGADWYDWAILAASSGRLVFRPNYRGSSGYGDKFMREIVPQIVSRPGKDILEGIDALVRDGIADPDHLTIGGYSYGGYMTNWLITQSTRFKAAVSGAGAVEHTANWGNDDLTFDDAYFLGGAPWQVQSAYNTEAAIWQMNKVKTPTHIVGGADDIRVSVGENYLLERALHTLGVASSLLIFPGEGHSLAKNPWHGKIKVREELKWLEQYDPLHP